MFGSKLTTAIINSMGREKMFLQFLSLHQRHSGTELCSVIAVIDTVHTDLTFMAPRHSGKSFRDNGKEIPEEICQFN